MDGNTTQILMEIRGLLYVITGLMVIWFVLWILTPASILGLLLREAFKKDWNEQAIEYFDTGDMEGLIRHCEERQKTHAYDPKAYYWQAKVCLAKGENDQARKYFKKVSEVSLDWYKEYVQPYYGDH